MLQFTASKKVPYGGIHIEVKTHLVGDKLETTVYYPDGPSRVAVYDNDEDAHTGHLSWVASVLQAGKDTNSVEAEEKAESKSA